MNLGATPPPDDSSFENGISAIAGGAAACAPGSQAITFPLKAADLILIFVLAAAAVVGVGILVGLVAAILGVNVIGGGSNIPTLLSTLTFQALAFFAVVHIMVLRRRRMSWADLGLRPVPNHWYRKALLAAALAFPLTWAVNALVQFILGRPFHNPQLAALAPDGFSWLGFIGMLVLIGLIFPLAEEILFRGIFYRWLRGKMGVAAAAGISAVCFSLLHNIPELIPAITILGIILALLYELSGSLWTSVVAHAAYNSINVALLYGLLGADVPIT